MHYNKYIGFYRQTFGLVNTELPAHCQVQAKKCNYILRM